MDETKPVEESNPTIQTPASVPPPKSNNRKMIIIGLGFLSTILIVGVLAFQDQIFGPMQTPTNPVPPPPTQMPPPPTPTPEDQEWMKVNIPLPAQLESGYKEPMVSGVVTWHKPTLREDVQITDKAFDTNSQGMIKAQVYELGTFSSGLYKDQKILVIFSTCEGPCPTFAYIGAKGNGTIVSILQKHSDEVYMADANIIKVDKTYEIPDLKFPDTIKTPEGITLTRSTDFGFFQPKFTFFNKENLEFVYEDAKAGAVFTTPDDPSRVKGIFSLNGFYVKSPDYRTILYIYTFEILDKDGVAMVTWSDGKNNREPYVAVTRGGCGASDYISIIHDLKDADLQKIGVTLNNATIYGLKDPNHKIYQEAYSVIYDSAKPTFEKFVADKPIFFWRDSFGRLVKFTQSKYQATAECAKPVIYLYPEKSTKVSVKVEPVGGFKFTEPPYNTGWNVIANPDGRLTDLATRKDYPYLFWEGWGGIYESPKQGWVVETKNLSSFLDEKLIALGLNQQETADFKEYWLPYMQDKPYYFVSFMGNRVADIIAPLSVSPKPDTVIRILMDFEPLDQPKAVQGYNITTPERKGFTVVEWGGVKH